MWTTSARWIAALLGSLRVLTVVFMAALRSKKHAIGSIAPRLHSPGSATLPAELPVCTLPATMRNLVHGLLVVCLLASALCRAMPAAGNGLFCGASGSQSNPILIARILASVPPELRQKAALKDDCCKLHCSAALISPHWSLPKFEAPHFAIAPRSLRPQAFEVRSTRSRDPPRHI